MLVLLGVAAGAGAFHLESCPPIETGGRVVDLFNGEHFDDLLKDTPSPMRPPSLVVFYDSKSPSCVKSYESLQFQARAESELPARERLMVAKYDMGVDRDRIWYQFTYEKDLPYRFGVDRQKNCPSIVFVPRKCDGWTEWCKYPNGSFGCPDYKEQCSDWKSWSAAAQPSWVKWAKELTEAEAEPSIARQLGSFKAQGEWLQSRTYATTNNHLRNAYLFPEIPQYTPTGVEIHDIPDNVFNRLMAYYERWKSQRYTEEWNTRGSTQLNFHEVSTTMVSLDLDAAERNELATKFFKPLLERWSKKKLQFNAFYGIREYYEGAFLHPHLDRIDTHVISATMSLGKFNATSSAEWPLRIVDPGSGSYVEYVHEPKTMIFYESSKVIHGRPTKNPVGGGVHAGCFVHFSVLGDDYSALKEKAKNSLSAKEVTVPYRSTASVEPAQPTYFDLAASVDTFKARAGAWGDKANNGKTSVAFTNDLKKDLYLFWVDDGGRCLSQGAIGGGSSMNLDSYPGHRFVWAAKEDPVAACRSKASAQRVKPRTRLIKASDFHPAHGEL